MVKKGMKTGQVAQENMGLSAEKDTEMILAEKQYFRNIFKKSTESNKEGEASQGQDGIQTVCGEGRTRIQDAVYTGTASSRVWRSCELNQRVSCARKSSD